MIEFCLGRRFCRGRADSVLVTFLSIKTHDNGSKGATSSTIGVMEIEIGQPSSVFRDTRFVHRTNEGPERPGKDFVPVRLC
tara:strand:- start:375 stop:617 length:243 start_codon:yes stop_codon:yes gene_type:complete